MPGFRFDPPLTLKGNIVVRNLDEAVRFIIGHREAHRPELRTSVLHRLEGAAGEAEERAARCISRLGGGRAPDCQIGRVSRNVRLTVREKFKIDDTGICLSESHTQPGECGHGQTAGSETQP
jgi:hypothetical protein